MPVLRPILFMPPILFLPPRRGGDLGDRGGGMPAGGWGFCSIRSLLPACRRRVAALMLQFPPRDGRWHGCGGPYHRCDGGRRVRGAHIADHLGEKWLTLA